MLNLFGVRRTPQDVAFRVGEPFLEHLVAAEAVGPDGRRYVAAEDFAVEPDVDGRLAERRQRVAHGGTFVVGEGTLAGSAAGRPDPREIGEIGLDRIAQFCDRPGNGRPCGRAWRGAQGAFDSAMAAGLYSFGEALSCSTTLRAG